jgi:hypothetical protein
MTNPWDIRKRQPKGDSTPDAIFWAVGRALTLWEVLESELAEVFDALISEDSSERIGFVAIVSVSGSQARGEILAAAAQRALSLKMPMAEQVHALSVEATQLRARRNDIAHGRCLNLGKVGFYFVPNNIATGKWKEGFARYQWVAADILRYADQFGPMSDRASKLAQSVRGATGKRARVGPASD